MLLVQIETLNKDSGDVKDKRNEDETNALRVAEEKARDVSLLNASFSWDDQKSRISVKDHIHVLWTKRNDRPVVENDVREKRVSLLVRIFHLSLVKLQFSHTKAAKNHERRNQSDDNR